MYIYKITNKINGKIYVGQTYKPVTIRFKEHLKESKYPIGMAIRKYGKENFIIEVIDTAESNELLNEKEIYWIKKLNSKNNKIGYNLTDGGDGIRGYKPSKESIEKNRQWHLGRKLSKDIKNKMSISIKKFYLENPDKFTLKEYQKGKNNAFYGKKHTRETKKKISETQKNMSESTKNKMSLAKKGKTYEEIYGKEKAEYMRDQRRKQNKGKTYEELYGEEKAKQMKNRIRESNRNRSKKH